MLLKKPSEIIMNFLRVNLSEIVRSGLSTRQTLDTELFNGDASNKEFTITRTDVLAIGEVTVGGVVQQPYVAYEIDLDNNKIVFGTAPAVGSNNVSIEYFYGDESWVFESDNSMSLVKSAYPFINVNAITEGGVPQAMGEDQTFDTVTFQIDVMAFNGMECTVEGETKTGIDVADYVGRKVLYQLLKNYRSQIGFKLFNPVKINFFPVPFNEGENNNRVVIEIRYDGFDVGD